MSTQLPLFIEPAPQNTVAQRALPQASWVLDEETRAIGLQHVAEARAILRARRANAERASLRRSGAQPAA